MRAWEELFRVGEIERILVGPVDRKDSRGRPIKFIGLIELHDGEEIALLFDSMDGVAHFAHEFNPRNIAISAGIGKDSRLLTAQLETAMRKASGALQ